MSLLKVHDNRNEHFFLYVHHTNAHKEKFSRTCVTYNHCLTSQFRNSAIKMLISNAEIVLLLLVV
jgi:hypothetical protein